MKYYTPDIAEFHVGFEYEFHQDGVWHEVACDLEVDHIKTLRDDIKNLKIRVKYLDQEDIESLWFVFKKKINAFEKELPKSNIIGMPPLCHLIMQENNKILICTGDCETSLPDWENTFFGTIKNKSELKRLLKQLGI